LRLHRQFVLLAEGGAAANTWQFLSARIFRKPYAAMGWQATHRSRSRPRYQLGRGLFRPDRLILARCVRKGTPRRPKQPESCPPDRKLQPLALSTKTLRTQHRSLVFQRNMTDSGHTDSRTISRSLLTVRQLRAVAPTPMNRSALCAEFGNAESIRRVQIEDLALQREGFPAGL
jgi:hypothetical protein